jgi:hypothetical protein
MARTESSNPCLSSEESANFRSSRCHGHRRFGVTPVAGPITVTGDVVLSIVLIVAGIVLTLRARP